MRSLLLVFALASLSACKTQFDLSPEAYASGDFTLVGALAEGPCKAIPVGGVDVCRVKDGSKAVSVWRLVIPQGGTFQGQKISGQVTAYFKDFSKTYPVDGNVLEIPLEDLVGPTWEKSDSGTAVALGQLEFTDSEGVKRTVQAEGMATFIVLSKDYDPLPMDSGQENWGLTCKVQYTTAGRSALDCK